MQVIAPLGIRVILVNIRSNPENVWLVSLFQNLSTRRTGLLSSQRRSGARQFAVTSAKLVRTMLWITPVVDLGLEPETGSGLVMEDRGAARCPHRLRALCGRNSQMCGTAGCWRISALTSASTRRWGSGGEEMIMHGRQAPQRQINKGWKEKSEMQDQGLKHILNNNIMLLHELEFIWSYCLAHCCYIILIHPVWSSEKLLQLVIKL